MTKIALIPARGGSLRVPSKNIKRLNDHPLIAYTISLAIQSRLFERIIVSTDSIKIKEIAEYYGADVPFIRPAQLATSVSIDIEWIKHAFIELKEKYDCFSILRPTSPFRTLEMLNRALNKFNELSEKYNIDSIRAVELCKQHPGKMWVLDGELLKTYVDQTHLDIPWHAGQYQALPKVYVQNSSLEIAWTRVVWETNSREGKIIAPFFTEEKEGFSIDYPYDWMVAEMMIKNGEVELPDIAKEPYKE